MKYIIGIILTILTGIILGFFGALVSVFADGIVGERLIVISFILLVYFFISVFMHFFYTDIHGYGDFTSVHLQ